MSDERTKDWYITRAKWLEAEIERITKRCKAARPAVAWAANNKKLPGSESEIDSWHKWLEGRP